jgi:hypothetical protein
MEILLSLQVTHRQEEQCRYLQNCRNQTEYTSFFKKSSRIDCVVCRKELCEKVFSEVSASHSVSFISQLEHRFAYKLGIDFVVQCLSFFLNHVTEKKDI